MTNESALKSNRLSTVSNFFSLKVVQFTSVEREGDGP